MDITRYIPERDEGRLMRLLEKEGSEWACYWAEPDSAKYRAALGDSITYVAHEAGDIRGYSRSLDDCGFYVYVCDLLVDRECRGQGIGRMLMDAVVRDYPGREVFVMSDEDGYYEKLGLNRAGSIFEVN